MIVFGPVTSRRLGKSLGINHIPHKYCTYSCVYCQVGNTVHLTGDPRHFYEPDRIYEIVSDKLDQLDQINEIVDFITLVPDGEPTLDKDLPELIAKLKKLGPPVAVISNGSLVSDPGIRSGLLEADWVSIKIDTIDEKIWRKINRPVQSMQLNKILEGMSSFAKAYKGILVTETMLIKNLNDSRDELIRCAQFIKKLNPNHAYLLIPTRPPAESWVVPPDEQDVTNAYYVFKEHFQNVTMLIDYPADTIPVTSRLEDDFLSVTSVHPIRKEEAERMISQADAETSVIDRLIEENKLMRTNYRGETFYIRKFRY